jgi:DNA-binding NarL/FixJ family response regulator
VLIADGQEVVRVGVRAMLDGEPDLLIVGEAGTLAGTLSEAKRVKPDLVLIESRFPDGSGVETCRMLLKSEPAIRAIIMTRSGDSSACRDAVEAGAHGYVLKDIGRAELLRAVRVVAGGASYLNADMAEQVLSVLKEGLGGAKEPGLHVLSPQERRLMPLVAEGKTNKEIAVELALSEKTVKNYMANMFAKLQVTRRTQAVALYVRAQRNGSFSHASFTNS